MCTKLTVSTNAQNAPQGTKIQNMVLCWYFVGTFQGCDPNIMGIVEKSSVSEFQKGLSQFGSSL